MASDVQRIVFAGGGTGGHVFPGLAVASSLQRSQPDLSMSWIGAAGGLEERLVPTHGIPLLVLPMAGIARRGLLSGLRALALAAMATLRLAREFWKNRPALLVGVGGFASGPAVLAAMLFGVPTLLLEQNAIPGRTNRALSLFASAVAVSFAESAERLRGRTVVTGNPVRREIAEIPERARSGLHHVLSFGGSRGAHALNMAWIEARPLLEHVDATFLIQTGVNDYPAVHECWQQRAEVKAFIDDMPTQFARADLIVGRAGATTVAELTAAGRPSVLVPYPYAADDHQRANALSLERAGAAIVIQPEELTAERLAEAVVSLANDPERIDSMARAARELGRRDAADAVAKLALDLIGENA